MVMDLAAVEVRVATELARRGGQLRKGEWWILCPVHPERTPSAAFRPGVGWNCQGCGAGGGILDAARVLGVGIDGATIDPADLARLEADRRAVAALRAEEERLAGLALAEYWQHSRAAAELARHGETLARLAAEGIDRLAIEHFGLGWHSYGIDGTGYPALVIPWTVGGEVRAVQYRILASDAPGGRYRWHKGSRATLFNADAVMTPCDDRIVVFEGAKKTIAAWTKGLESCCGIVNKGGWNPEWAKRFAPFKTVVFALDPDASAEAVAAARTIPGARVARVPTKPDDLLVQSGGDIEILMAYIDQAKRVD